MDWISALSRLRSAGEPSVLVTITDTRGHSPRSAGAKMVVSADESWDSIGGGNLEATAIEHSRRMLTEGRTAPETEEISLNPHTPTRHGQQCCGGVVHILFEPFPAAQTVAVFGLGHIGQELAGVLSRLPISLHLADSREGFADQSRFPDTAGGRAQLHLHHAPAPEALLNTLPAGTHVLIMTHDHAEDLFLCEAALRRGDLGSVGVIGSSAKWSRFRKQLREAGYQDTRIETISCPIGLPEITGKSPEVIALSVAAAIVRTIELTSDTTVQEQP